MNNPYVIAGNEAMSQVQPRTSGVPQPVSKQTVTSYANALNQTAQASGQSAGAQTQNSPQPTKPVASATTQTVTKKTSGGSSGGGGSTKKVTYVDNGSKNTGVVQQEAKPEAEPVPSYWDTMRDEYQKYYDEQVAANNAALENARQRAQEAADAQIAAMNEGYRGTNRQLYRDYMEKQRVLPQQMAAQGYSGGLTESSRLKLGNAYQESLAENERARIAQEASANQGLAQQLYEAQAAADAANLQASQNRYSYLSALRQQEYQQQRQELENRAAMLGSVGDFSAYKELGYSDAEIAYLQAMFRKMNPDLFGSSGGGGSKGGSGGSTSKGKGTPNLYAQVDELRNAGLSDREVLSAISNSNLTPAQQVTANTYAVTGQKKAAQTRKITSLNTSR
jgi:hypothetical protein